MFSVFRYLLVLILFSFTGYGQTQSYNLSFPSPSELHAFFYGNNTVYPLVSAHRGGPTDFYPENCTATFANTIQFTPAIIETDIAMTKDSVLVMMHDNTLDRTTTGTGPIQNYTYKELQSLFLKDNIGNVTSYSIETLDKILQWGKDKVVYTLDVKKGVPFKKIVEAVRRNHAERYAMIITYNANQAAEVAQLAPDLLLSVSANGKEDIERMESMGVSSNNMVAFVGTTFPKLEVMTYMCSRGISCISGTMGNIDKKAEVSGDAVYLDLVKEGVRFISTDRPKALALQLASFIQQNQFTTPYIVKKNN